MDVEGNIRKMPTELVDGEAQYRLRLYDILEPLHELPMADLIGQEIEMEWTGSIHCAVTGVSIKKTYGDGLSYKAFMESPMASPSIIRPELSRIHEGIALRDEDWERKHHLQPHIVYLSRTSGVKVGVTRSTNVPYRWIDQGAVEAMPIAEVPYRQAAGLIEVALKGHLSDKTNWRNMLTGQLTDERPLNEVLNSVKAHIPAEWQNHVVESAEICHISYPTERLPLKVKSFKLDKMPHFRKRLMGIKGQYLLFSDDTVMNMRSHSAYRVRIKA